MPTRIRKLSKFVALLIAIVVEQTQFNPLRDTGEQ
jgi:hypothetical protein